MNIELDEGSQYRFGPLVLDGEEPRPGAGQELIDAWKPYIGTISDSRMLEKFAREYVFPLKGEFRFDREDANNHHIVWVGVMFPSGGNRGK